jgi:hypothetical protein
MGEAFEMMWKGEAIRVVLKYAFYAPGGVRTTARPDYAAILALH